MNNAYYSDRFIKRKSFHPLFRVERELYRGINEYITILVYIKISTMIIASNYYFWREAYDMTHDLRSNNQHLRKTQTTPSDCKTNEHLDMSIWLHLTLNQPLKIALENRARKRCSVSLKIGSASFQAAPLKKEARIITSQPSSVTLLGQPTWVHWLWLPGHLLGWWAPLILGPLATLHRLSSLHLHGLATSIIPRSRPVPCLLPLIEAKLGPMDDLAVDEEIPCQIPRSTILCNNKLCWKSAKRMTPDYNMKLVWTNLMVQHTF